MTGIRQNAPQFALLVVINALVGATIGLERSLLPAIAEGEFHVSAHSAMLSFIAVFGFAKAITNGVAGRLSDAIGRKPVLVAGWVVAIPFPFLLMWAPSWGWVLVANALLGVSQGLTWSTTVIMKIDLAGPSQRGLAMGLNEFAGYVAVAASALATAAIAEATNVRPEPFYLGAAFVFAGLGLSALFARETREFARGEAVGPAGPGLAGPGLAGPAAGLWPIHQAGLVNNLNDGVAWGLFPVLYAGAGMDLSQIGWLVASYPAVWGLTQIATGALSDRLGRRALVAGGMALQAAAIGVVVTSDGFPGFLSGNVLLGLGTAMVYPTLLAAIGDVAHPGSRASAVGGYRLWRDLGYPIGAIAGGLTADILGVETAIWLVAAATLGSGVVFAVSFSAISPRSSR